MTGSRAASHATMPPPPLWQARQKGPLFRHAAPTTTTMHGATVSCKAVSPSCEMGRGKYEKTRRSSLSPPFQRKKLSPPQPTKKEERGYANDFSVFLRLFQKPKLSFSPFPPSIKGRRREWYPPQRGGEAPTKFIGLAATK